MIKDTHNEPNELICTVRVLQYKDGSFEERYDKIVKDDFLTIKINDTILGTIAYLPHQAEYLAFGFLITEGFIKKISDITSWHIEGKTFSATVKGPPINIKDKTILLSGCGKGITFRDCSHDDIMKLKTNSSCVFSADKILKRTKEFLKLDAVHLSTGGTHASAIATQDDILFLAADIGRHSAIQKVIGWAFLNQVDVKGKFILSTGRISHEAVFYALASGISLIVSPSAPMSSAIKIAKKTGITIIGFVKGSRLSIFSHQESIDKAI